MAISIAVTVIARPYACRAGEFGGELVSIFGLEPKNVCAAFFTFSSSSRALLDFNQNCNEYGITVNPLNNNLKIRTPFASSGILLRAYPSILPSDSIENLIGDGALIRYCKVTNCNNGDLKKVAGLILNFRIVSAYKLKVIAFNGGIPSEDVQDWNLYLAESPSGSFALMSYSTAAAGGLIGSVTMVFWGKIG